MRSLRLLVPIALLATLVSACGSAPAPTSQDDVVAPEATAATMATDAPADTAAPEDTAAPAGTISRESMGDKWPLTVDSGVVACDGTSTYGAVTFTANGVTYGVNGAALQQGLPKIDPIWSDDPSIPGTKINIGPIIDAGLALCK